LLHLIISGGEAIRKAAIVFITIWPFQGRLFVLTVTLTYEIFRACCSSFCFFISSSSYSINGHDARLKRVRKGEHVVGLRQNLYKVVKNVCFSPGFCLKHHVETMKLRIYYENIMAAYALWPRKRY
jgi:hypothetical protein